MNCPISADRVNENAVRASAFICILVTLAGIYFKSYIVIGLLAIDFELRAFSDGKSSIIKNLAKEVVRLIGIKNKPVDAAPKRFAAGVGLVVTLIIASLQLLQLYFAAELVAGVLILCALLEGAFGFCLGCHIYTLFIFPLTQQNGDGENN